MRDAEEAKSANLKEKHLHVLGLFWGDDNGNMGLENDTESLHSTGSSLGDDSDARSREVEDILECLEPHPNLKKLFIKGYPGIRY